MFDSYDDDMCNALWECSNAFEALRRRDDKHHSAEWWANCIESQVLEAKQHLLEGKSEKAMNEIADCIIVAFDALRDFGVHPKDVVINRVKTRVLPRVNELHQTYGHGDGHKPKDL